MKQKTKSNFEQKLAEKHLCYVLITCDKPENDGHMQVEMSYSGDDPVLASFLLKGAQNAIDQSISEEQPNPMLQLRVVK
ncbi:MAG: hypothetical protein Tsb0021_09490 [Chlamydiales bacterium]